MRAQQELSTALFFLSCTSTQDRTPMVVPERGAGVAKSSITRSGSNMALLPNRRMQTA